MNIAIAIGFFALVIKFTADFLDEIRTVSEDGTGGETFSIKKLGHVVPVLKVLSAGAALVAGIVAVANPFE